VIEKLQLVHTKQRCDKILSCKVVVRESQIGNVLYFLITSGKKLGKLAIGLCWCDPDLITHIDCNLMSTGCDMALH
jgi:hypothetical protein